VSWARALASDAALEAGYRLHRLGLAGSGFEVTPGYARAEEQLRRVTRLRLPPSVPWESVAAALGGEPASEDAADRAWYLRRREAGEGREAAPLAAAVEGLATGWRPAGEVAFVVSPALRTLPCLASRTAAACGGSATVAAGPGLPPSLGLLGAAALGVEEVVRSGLPEELPFETVHFVVCMVAGSRLVHAGLEGAALETLLTDATRLLLPPQHREGVIERRIQSLVRHRLIDQPPGEIERTIHGLARRRADRLHRAWLRWFFVPRGVSLA
jgi:hypothetical protein